MKRKTLKEVFDEHTDMTVDKRFAKALIQQVIGFLNKNDTHTQFFGGNLLGVYPIRYTPRETNAWLEELLGIEEIKDCQSDIYEVEGITKEFFISSNVMNLSFVYVLNRLFHSDLDKMDKELAIQYTLIYVQAKHLSGLQVERFKYPADPFIAMALYESLDKRTDLKMAGSWLQLLTDRAETISDEKKGIHYHTFVDMDDVDDIVYMTNDLNGRLADMLNTMTEKFHLIKDSQARILSSSNMTTMEGETVLKEYQNSTQRLLRDMAAITIDRNDFIRDELLDFTTEVITTCEERYLKEVLTHYSDNFKSIEKYREALDTIIVYVINLARTKKISLSNVPELITVLRSLFRASRTKKEEILKIKELLHDVVSDGIPKARDSVVVATQIGLFIYVVLRMLSISHYR